MWLSSQNVPVIVAVVLLSVWANIARAKSDSHPRLNHFNLYGCNSEPLFQNVNLKYLRQRGRFYIGVNGSSKTNISLVSSRSSLPCELPSDVLFCALPDRENITIKFQQVLFKGKDPEQKFVKGCIEESGNAIHNKVDENAEEVGGNHNSSNDGIEQGHYVTCNVSRDAGQKFILRSGYGFISCHDNPDVNKELWMKWQKGVADVEKEATQARMNTIIGVVSGTCVVVVVIFVCVVCRLRSASSAAYHSRRRPSNISARTGSTNDHLPSRV